MPNLKTKDVFSLVIGWPSNCSLRCHVHTCMCIYVCTYGPCPQCVRNFSGQISVHDGGTVVSAHYNSLGQG